MGQTIDVYSGKYLSIKQAVQIHIEGDTNIGALIASSTSKLKAHNISITGTPIIWEMINFDGRNINLERKIILQYSGNAEDIPAGFVKKESQKIGPCMYARFNGIEENLIYASQKVSVFAYENEINLKKESYTVYVEKNKDVATIDIFIPYED